MKKTLLAALLLASMAPAVADAQIHPLAFGADATYLNPNWYYNYVGTRIDVISPAPVAGLKMASVANDGSGATYMWGGALSAPLINKQIVMPQPGDSLAGAPITVDMTGKVALVYRGGGIEYSSKALAAQNAGALACIIVNDQAGLPAILGAGVGSGSVTIPVYMISKAEGDPIDVQYLLGAAPRVTITNWGSNNNNDLGFVPQGLAGWSNFATPSNQLFPGTSLKAYNGLDGAFIANYGTHKATNVKVNSTLTYVPATGAPSVLHSGVTPTLTSFLTADSIYAMFDAAEYSFAPPAAGTGRYDLKYTIVSDSVDQNPRDNTATYSFYTTDSIYSKGQFDFVNNKPVAANYIAPGGGNNFMWGPMYYVARGGTALSSVQFSLHGPTSGSISLSGVNVFAFKWVDGSAGMDHDSLVQNGELALVATGLYVSAPTDTSGGIFKVNMADPFTGAAVLLDAASWYYISVEVPGGYFLGVDGRTSPYARVMGRSNVSNTVDYSGILWNGDYNAWYNPMLSYPTAATAPCPFPGSYYVNSIDSFNYNTLKGLVPAVAMIANNNPISLINGDAALCVGDNTSFTNPIAGGTWSSSNTAVATIDPATGYATGVAPGTATITYATSLSSATIIVSVDIAPTVGPISGPGTVCVGSSVLLTDPVPGGTWALSGTGAITISSAGVVNGVSEGVEYIAYIISNACNVAFNSTMISVGPAIVTGTISGPSAVCAGSFVNMAATATGGVWSTALGNAAASAGVVTGGTAGIDTVKYTVSSACGSEYTTAVITINALPTPVISTTGVTLSTTMPYTSYQWLYTGSAISGATDPTYVVTLNGSYAVTVSDANGCFNTSGLALVGNVGVSNVAGKTNSLVISPNPTSGMFVLQTGTAGVFTVYTATGKEVIAYKVAAGSARLILPKDLAAGAYMCRFDDEHGGTTAVRLVYQP